MAQIAADSGVDPDVDTAGRPASHSTIYVDEDAGWLRVASLLTGLYMVAGLMLIGVPAISRSAIVVALVCALWAIYGLLTHKARFPRVLILPVLFYVMVILSGFMVDPYPVTYIGQVTTIWLAAISIALFVANGMSLKPVLIGFALVYVANVIAIAVGYDGYQVNAAVNDAKVDPNTVAELGRRSGLAGQANLLMALTIAPLMLMFLRRRRLATLAWLALFAAAVWMSVMTGSRSGLIPAAMFLVMAGFVLVRSPLVRRSMPILIGIVVVGWLIQSMQPNLLLRIEQSALGEAVVVQRFVQAIDGTDGSSLERQQFIERAWGPFLARPVFGHGPAAFERIVGQGTYAHNSFAELSVNFGMIGLALWFGMYALAGWGVLRSPYKLPALCTILMMLAMDQTYVVYLERELVLVMCLLLVFTGRSLIRRSRRMFLDDSASSSLLSVSSLR